MPRRSPAAVAPRPEVLAFLQAIKENPDDDGVRLMLADWLQERGDPRGEFLQLQVNVERLPQTDPRREALETQAQVLLARHRLDWLGPLPHDVPFGNFRRGLLHLTLGSSRCFGSQADALASDEAWSWVEHLNINGLEGERFGRFAASPLSQPLPSLRIHLSSELPAEAARVFADGAGLPNLRSLRLTGWGESAMRFAEGVCAGNPRLFPRLTTLHLGDGLGPEGLKALANSASLSGLNALILDWLRGAEGLVHLTASAHLGGLRRLSLNQGRVGPSAATMLAESRKLLNLSELELKDNEIGSEGAAALAASPNLPALKCLDLPNTKIGPEGAIAIAASSQLRTLTHLGLAGNRIGDPGLLALASSPQLSGLQSLDLRDIRISDKAARALAHSKTLKGITRFRWTDYTGNTTADRSALLRERFGYDN